MSTMLKKDFSKTKPVCKVTFTLPLEAAQGGKEVRILGDFNEWSWDKGYKMKAQKAEFTTEVELAAGKQYQFRYLIDNHIWENDWNADGYEVSPFGGYNSVLSLKEVAAAATAKAAATAPKAVAKPAAETKTAAPKAAAKPVAKVAAPKAVAKPVAEVAAPKAVAKPAVVAAPKAVAKAVVADDLTKIEGIGPKIAELLKAAGIVTFAKLADTKAATVKGILDAAGKRYQMHDPSTWANQSKLAATGDWAKLTKLQDSLKGGKK